MQHGIQHIETPIQVNAIRAFKGNAVPVYQPTSAVFLCGLFSIPCFKDFDIITPSH
ncbi:hypothetical protein [Pedobacter rhizosphaerae]|uniref:hypothetical protein n=1 Tax=Pedobacter rhizosphaerae TaxID=390241 RepID=UPI001587592D|nr:hypothetical protein [Pedobacter rhizosphaerae]